MKAMIKIGMEIVIKPGIRTKTATNVQDLAGDYHAIRHEDKNGDLNEN